MGKPKAQDCADLARSLLGGPTIPYVAGKESLDPAIGADCQGLIEAIVRKLGGRMSYLGSNDMWRNGASWVGTIAEAKASGRLVPGAGLLIVEQDGGEPAKYKVGGSAYKAGYDGNASHVGLYVGSNPEIVHASASKGKVTSSTLKNAWTHVILFADIDYSGFFDTKEKKEAMFAIVRADEGSTVRLRKSASTSSKAIILENVPVGSQVEVLERGSVWSKVRWQKDEIARDGYMMSAYLKFDGEEEEVAPPNGVEARLTALEQIVQEIRERLGM